MFKKAATLAQKLRSVVILRLTTHVCHAKEVIRFDEWKPVVHDDKPRFDPDASNYIPLAATVFPLKRAALERLEALQHSLPSMGFDTFIDAGNASRGIIVAGLPFASLMDSLESCMPGASRPDILKLGAIYPFDRALVLGFLKTHTEVRILEELDPILETDCKALAYDEHLTCTIIGKKNVDEAMGEYTPGAMLKILRATWPDLFAPASGIKDEGSKEATQAVLPPRPAQLCPGCGHRSAFYAIKKALRPDDITVADIGCHTLGYLPPYSMGRVLLSMGHSTSTAAGLSLLNKERRVLCFLGDSTFFHAGLPGIVNAVYNNHTVLLVIMENGTTAMTGHQDHPGTGKNFSGATQKLSVRAALEGLGVKNIREVDTYKQNELTAMVKEALDEPGFKVIIARHPCMLKFTREARRKPGWSARRVKIDQEICDRIHECVERFACPSFQRDDEGVVIVSKDLCIGDGSCKQTCPVQAIVQDE